MYGLWNWICNLKLPHCHIQTFFQHRIMIWINTVPAPLLAAPINQKKFIPPENCHISQYAERGLNKTLRPRDGTYTRVGKVEKWSNMSIIKVVDFFIIFDKNLVWKKYFFHGYGFFKLEDSHLAGQCWGSAWPS